MKLVQSHNNIVTPFFSVCIETHNRGKTIYRALDALLTQGIQDFECIIVDDLSDDNTVAEVLRFIDSEEYQKKGFHIKMYKNDKHLGGVLNWNSPLSKASGKYIACLEGDDYYLPNYLHNAFNFINLHPNVGIYSAGSQRRLRRRTGYIKAVDYFRYIYQLSNICPPSETIFKRLNKSNAPFQYNIKDNVYAPEIELLLLIASDGWDGFHTKTAEIYREPSTSNANLTWKSFKDRFRILEIYRSHELIDDNQIRESFNRQYKRAAKRYLYSLSRKNGDSMGLRKGLLSVLEKKNFPGSGFKLKMLKMVFLLKALGIFKVYFAIKKVIN